jgi:hypothetical protein
MMPNDETAIGLLIPLLIIAVTVVAGGALGARLARAPAWKGAVIAFSAAALQLVAAELLDIENAVVQCLIFLLLVGLVGGRFGLGLTARQMAPVVIGSFLVPSAVMILYVYVYALSVPGLQGY